MQSTLGVVNTRLTLLTCYFQRVTKYHLFAQTHITSDRIPIIIMDGKTTGLSLDIFDIFEEWDDDEADGILYENPGCIDDDDEDDDTTDQGDADQVEHGMIPEKDNSSVVNFTLNGTTRSTVVTENDTNLQIKCLVDSNPESNIIVQNKTQILKTVVNGNILDFSLSKVMCTDAGQYTCFGYNKYNTRNDSQDVSLFVMCSPRPSPFVQLEYNISSALNMPATLKFTALAFPEPSTEEYSWFKENDPIKNSSEMIISSYGLETNLTIVNITESSSGIYRLIVKNSMGSFQQMYFLQAADIPNAPTELVYLEEKATDTSIYLEWKPGFNGGSQQTFILQYKKTGTQYWKNTSKTHDGETIMNYTIQHLSSDAQYEVIIFAVNRIGRSKGSIKMTISTKESKRDGGTPGTLIGVAVGVGLGCVVVLIVGVASFVYIRRKVIRKERRALHGQELNTCQYMDLNVSHTVYTNTSSVYSELAIHKESTSKPTPEDDAKVYVNLQIRHNLGRSSN